MKLGLYSSVDETKGSGQNMERAGDKTGISLPESSLFYNDKLFLSITAAAMIVYVAVFLINNQNGYGDNHDNYLMLRSWQEMAARGVYVPSRFQGNIPSEIILGFLASLLGPTGANGFSFFLSIIALGIAFYFFAEICADRKKTLLAILTIAFNPFWINASTTSMDYIHPIAFFLLGLLFLDKKLSVAGAIFFSVASGCRISYAPMGAGTLALYAFFNHEKGDRAVALQAISVFFAVTALIYLPVFISSHLSLSFLGSARPTWQGTTGLLARWAYKFLYLYGFIGTSLIVYGFAQALRSRFTGQGKEAPARVQLIRKICFFVIAYHAILFLYIPVRIEYLLPVLIAVAGLCLTSAKSRFFLTALIVAEISYWFISIDILKIEYKYNYPCDLGTQAVGARIEPHLVAGFLLPHLKHETLEQICSSVLIERPTNIHDRLPRPRPDLDKDH